MALWQRARLGMLPDVLSVWGIACLGAGDDQQDLVLPVADLLVEAVVRGDLKAQKFACAQEPDAHDPFSIATAHFECVSAELFPCPDSPPPSNDGYRMSVQRDDFVAFLCSRGLGVPDFWFGELKQQSKAGRAAHAEDFEAQAFARKIAEDSWREDKNSTPERIGDIALYIQKQLLADKFGHYTSKTIKSWIADLAPEGARRSGRPPKTP